MQEEWISLNEYSRRYKMHPIQVKKLISEGKVDCFLTKCGYYKIKVGGQKDTKREEELLQENAELKATIRNMQSILSQVQVWKGGLNTNENSK